MGRLGARTIAAATAVLLAGGCGAGEPHVLDTAEFDRQAATFNRPPPDRDALAVCYDGTETARARAQEVAAQACGRFDKNAVFARNAWGECPLLTPVEAHFACVVR
jgi:hypothetical protein